MPNESNPPDAGQLSYLDFELEVGPGSGRDYPVAVVRSPAGEAHAACTSALSATLRRGIR